MGYTNIGLVAHAEKALKEGWYYLWGAYGQIATQTVLDNNIKQYPVNESWRNYAKGAIGKTRFCDCYGLVKSFLWWTDDKSNPKYKNTQDRNTANAYSAAKENGPLSTLPEVPGVILWMTGHVGVYCGSGRFIELQGGGTGAYAGKIENGRITRGSKFTHWFKDVEIEYIEGGLTMDQYNELKVLLEQQGKEIDKLKSQVTYGTINDVPAWGKEAIQHLISKGGLADPDNLDLSYEMLRIYVTNYRMGCYH